MKIASRFRPSLIPNLSASHSISPLINRHNHSKVLTLFKLILFTISPTSYPSPFLKFLPHTPYPIRFYHPRNLSPLSAKSASLTKSFFPSSILLWNALPSDLKESSSLAPSSQKTLFSLPVLTLTPTIIT